MRLRPDKCNRHLSKRASKPVFFLRIRVFRPVRSESSILEFGDSGEPQTAIRNSDQELFSGRRPMKRQAAIGFMLLSLGLGGLCLAAEAQKAMVIHAGHLFD